MTSVKRSGFRRAIECLAWRGASCSSDLPDECEKESYAAYSEHPLPGALDTELR